MIITHLSDWFNDQHSAAMWCKGSSAMVIQHVPDGSGNSSSGFIMKLKSVEWDGVSAGLPPGSPCHDPFGYKHNEVPEFVQALSLDGALDICYGNCNDGDELLNEVIGKLEQWILRHCRLMRYGRRRSDFATVIYWNDHHAEWDEIVAMMKELGV